jgi:diguanylate cyclase (GGDEF)-like protein
VADEAVDLSLIDSLTGLYNRRALVGALRQRVAAGPGGVVLLDLDEFRKAVAPLTRDLSDRLVIDVASRLLTLFGRDALLYRYAGDAFCVLLPGADRDAAAAAAEKMRDAMGRDKFRLAMPVGVPITVGLTASVGVAAWPADAASPPGIMEAAERALFVAKRTGRNRVAVAGQLDPAALAEIGVFRGLPCPILVGRATEESRLRQLALQVREAGPAIALLTGPAGVGKSRLLEELCRWARGERFVLLTASCAETRSTTPYAALVEQVERLLGADRARALAAFEKLPAPQRVALSLLVRDVPAPQGDVEGDRAKVTFDAFNALVDELAKLGPILVTADEIEHADDASVEVWRGAVERRRPVLIAGAAEGGIEKTPAGELVRDLGGLATRLALGPLPADEMRRMLGTILPGAEVAPEAVEQLVGASGGNPLYLEEAIQLLVLRGRMKLVSGRWTLPKLVPEDVPKDLEAAIRGVAASLPSDANWLLTRAAVIGARVDAELLQEVLGEREAEVFDYIDEVRRSRLLLASEGEDGVLFFPAAHARRVRLLASDANERKAIHARVGVVQEARFGGDVAHLAEELSYHYGRGGQDQRARHFDGMARRRAQSLAPPKTRGTRRARIPPAAEPMPSGALEHALSWFRQFVAAVKIGRLYPQRSQVESNLLTQMRQGLEGVLAQSPGLTFATAASGATVNGVAAKGGAAADFAALLDERLIESVTITRAFVSGTLDRILRAFVAPFDRVRAAPDHWDRFLDQERLEGIDLVQKAYQAREGDAVAVAKADQPVPPSELPALRDVLRFLKGAVDALRLYPPAHPLVEETGAQAAKTASAFLSRVPAVTLGAAEGELVVNGYPADRQFFGEGGAFVVKEVTTRDLGSISLAQGIAEDEVRALVSFLTLPPEPGVGAAAETLLGQMRHVAFGSARYERATRGEGGGGLPLRPPPKPKRSELRARGHLAKPYETFFTEELEREFPKLVESLEHGALRPLAEQLVDRLAEHFHDASLPHRRRAIQLLEDSLAYASPGTRQLQIQRSAPAVKQRLTMDTDARAMQMTVELLVVWVPAAATSWCLPEVGEAVVRPLRSRADASATPAEIRALAEQALKRVIDSPVFPALLASLKKPSEEERKAAAELLLALGGAAHKRLVEAFVEEEDAGARRALASLLAPGADGLAPELGAHLAPSAPEERLVRVLQAIDPLVKPSLAGTIAMLLDHPSAAVKKEVVRLSKAGPRPLTLAVVRRRLGGPPEERDAAIEAATQMKLLEVSADIGRMLEEAQDELLLQRCCRYFAGVPNAAVIPRLAEIALRRPKLFGIIKGHSARLRAAAVLALMGQGSNATADAAVNEALRDAEVRALTREG